VAGEFRFTRTSSQHPDDISRLPRMGDLGFGRWEGDTFVVDVNGDSTTKTWIGGTGRSTPEQMPLFRNVTPIERRRQPSIRSDRREDLRRSDQALVHTRLHFASAR
jgi:hypothetical protein